MNTALHSFAMSLSRSVPWASCLRHTASSHSLESQGCVDFCTVTLFLGMLSSAMCNNFSVNILAPYDGCVLCRNVQSDSAMSLFSLSQSALRNCNISRVCVCVCEAVSGTLKATLVTTLLWSATAVWGEAVQSGTSVNTTSSKYLHRVGCLTN